MGGMQNNERSRCCDVWSDGGWRGSGDEPVGSEGTTSCQPMRRDYKARRRLKGCQRLPRSKTMRTVQMTRGNFQNPDVLTVLNHPHEIRQFWRQCQ